MGTYAADAGTIVRIANQNDDAAQTDGIGHAAHHPFQQRPAAESAHRIPTEARHVETGLDDP